MVYPDILNQFVNALVKTTLAGNTHWEKLSANIMIDGYRVSDLLGQDEFHQIRYFDSYYCEADSHTIFFVNEFNESGRDPIYDTSGYHLFLKNPLSASLASLMFDTPELYRLRNAIQTTTDDDPNIGFMKAFIETANETTT